MPVVLAAKAVKKKHNEKHVFDKLHESGGYKFLAVADVEFTPVKKKGHIMEHPSLITGTKNFISGATGGNKRVFAAVQTEEGDILFLLLVPKGMDDISADVDAAGLLKVASLEKKFATDDGSSILTSSNTKVKKGHEHVYVFQPNDKESFELKFVVEGKHKHSEDNRSATEAWIEAELLSKN